MKKSFYITLLLSFLAFSLSACSPDWQIEFTKDGRSVGQFSFDDFSFYLAISGEEDAEGELLETILLGQMLYINGFTLIDEITLIDEEGNESTFIWEEIALETRLSNKGKVTIEGQEYTPVTIDVSESALASEIEYSITDIAPTMAHILGLPELVEASGEILMERSAEHGVLILIDGTQYQKLQALIADGKLPFLASLDKIHQGLTVYPPVTAAASAALLTGAIPQVNGAYGHGFRSTELTTLFDLVVREGKSVIAIEGASLPFNLRNAEVTISGDRDGNGFSDDNVFTNSLEAIDAGMPDLLYIHFHEIDDMGHEYGPESDEYEQAAIRVDGYLSQIYEALPTGTFIIIFADHGMHAEGEGGNHGNLIASDLIIPIIFLEK
jgi:hypothetical protein